jgi:hypothetical protein
MCIHEKSNIDLPPRAPSSPRKATAKIRVKTKESIFVFVLLGALGVLGG